MKIGDIFRQNFMERSLIILTQYWGNDLWKFKVILNGKQFDTGEVITGDMLANHCTKLMNDNIKWIEEEQ